LKFLADESCDFRVVRALREYGHDVLAVCEFAKRLEDPDVIDLSVREDRILITEDKDFGQLVFAHGHGTRGVILVRYPAVTRRGLPTDLVRLVEQKKHGLRNSFVVLEPGRFRVARLPA
jgi:predicted nuclease of predicted toxin-antitoxin system